MAVSNSSGVRHEGNFWRRVFGRLSRYDVLLAAIPLLLAVAVTVYVLFPVPFHLAVTAGATLSCLLVTDALFLNPPTGS